MQARVTLVIRTYNRGRLLARAIDSALGQSYPHVVVLVVDDGSTDDTIDVVHAYAGDPRVRLVRHPGNQGSSAAANTGIEHFDAETVYFGLLDSDDTLEPDAVEVMVRAFMASGDAYSFVVGWCRDMESGASTGTLTHLQDREGLVTYADALAGRFTGEFWFLARRDILDGLRFDARARGGESAVWWRMLQVRPGWVIPAVVRNYARSGSDRLSVPRYDPDVARGQMWAERAILHAIGADLRRQSPRSYGRRLSDLSKWAALAGARATARSAARQGLRYAPSPRSLIMCFVVMLPAPVLRALAEGTKEIRLRGTGG